MKIMRAHRPLDHQFQAFFHNSVIMIAAMAGILQKYSLLNNEATKGNTSTIDTNRMLYITNNAS